MDNIINLNPNNYPGAKWRITRKGDVYDFQPGNGTRYCLVFTDLGNGDKLLSWLRESDVGGRSFRFRDGMGRVGSGYFAHKMGLMGQYDEADIAALLAFAKWAGVEVDLVAGYGEDGCRE